MEKAKAKGFIKVISLLLGIMAVIILLGLIIISINSNWNVNIPLVIVYFVVVLVQVNISWFAWKFAGNVDAARGIFNRGIVLLIFNIMPLIIQYFYNTFKPANMIILLLPILLIIAGKINEVDYDDL